MVRQTPRVPRGVRSRACRVRAPGLPPARVRRPLPAGRSVRGGAGRTPAFPGRHAGDRRVRRHPGRRRRCRPPGRRRGGGACGGRDGGWRRLCAGGRRRVAGGGPATAVERLRPNRPALVAFAARAGGPARRPPCRRGRLRPGSGRSRCRQRRLADRRGATVRHLPGDRRSGAAGAGRPRRGRRGHRSVITRRPGRSSGRPGAADRGCGDHRDGRGRRPARGRGLSRRGRPRVGTNRVTATLLAVAVGSATGRRPDQRDPRHCGRWSGGDRGCGVEHRATCRPRLGAGPAGRLFRF